MGMGALAGGGIYLLNASWLAPPPQGRSIVLAHRGVHQTYDPANIGGDDCTATRIHRPSNTHIENTIPSMQASFEAGADIVELDIHPTADGEFAVFHDWTLDCRTNGTGVTRQQPMTYLRSLDVGYGYTHDGGRTFPLRGKGVGLMPTLNEVLTAFPGKRFLINFKSRDASEGDRLIAYLKARGFPTDERLMVYGDKRPVERVLALAPKARGFSKAQSRQCTVQYLALGWIGIVPDACERSFIPVPVNLRWAVWGWPNRFFSRMRKAGATVIMVGPLRTSGPVAGIDTTEHLQAVPRGFDVVIWTDAVERIGPAARAYPEIQAARRSKLRKIVPSGTGA